MIAGLLGHRVGPTVSAVSDRVERVIVSAADGRRLDVLVSAGDGATTVVLHMGTPSGLAALPQQFVAHHRSRLVLYARPGYGESTPQPGRSVADAAADTATILDSLGVESFVTAGWSGGGPHALACAALLPDRCLATAVVAGVAPSSAGVDNGMIGKMGMALRGDEDGLAAALDADRAESITMGPDDVLQWPTSGADRAALTGEFAEWLVDSIRAAYATGVTGAHDDWMAFAGGWDFDLAEVRNVTIWHGDEDENVTPANAHWLAEHIPGSALRILPGEGHLSIGLRLPEILDDLITRA
jgi:pimeloyl-ACP methyl ester carboxylesterase